MIALPHVHLRRNNSEVVFNMQTTDVLPLERNDVIDMELNPQHLGAKGGQPVDFFNEKVVRPRRRTLFELTLPRFSPQVRLCWVFSVTRLGCGLRAFLATGLVSKTRVFVELIKRLLSPTACTIFM